MKKLASLLFSVFISSIFFNFKFNENEKISINQEIAKPYKILFAGDMMFDRYIRTVSIKNGYDYILGDIKDFLLEYDLVVANLEGSITDFDSVSVGSEIGSRENYIFTFDNKVSNLLYSNNIKVVNLGNNHIFNFGKEGIFQTKDELSKNGIYYFGDTGLNEENSYYSLTINNLETVFINYNQFIAGGLEQTIANLNKFKDKNVFIVLYAHWGDEYLANPSFRTVELAHQFIDEGADLVIGSHPHVIQKREIYNGKQIYYSLGNFVFDQYFSKETTEGLLVELSIDPFSKNYSTKEYKVTLLTNGQTILLE